MLSRCDVEIGSCRRSDLLGGSCLLWCCRAWHISAFLVAMLPLPTIYIIWADSCSAVRDMSWAS